MTLGFRYYCLHGSLFHAREVQEQRTLLCSTQERKKERKKERTINKSYIRQEAPDI